MIKHAHTSILRLPDAHRHIADLSRALVYLFPGHIWTSPATAVHTVVERGVAAVRGTRRLQVSVSKLLHKLGVEERGGCVTGWACHGVQLWCASR